MTLTKVGSALLYLSLACGALAYVPPRGIPDPGKTWGAFHPIDTPKPTRTAIAPGWFEAKPRENSITAGDAHDCYYVDNTHPSATDTANTYGTPALPRKTIPNKVFSAGSYVEIHGDGATGNYQYTGTFSPRGNGTDTNPIWFVGVSQPILSGLLNMGAEDTPRISYMVFDGIRWQNGGRFDIRPRFSNNSIDHVAFRNCVILGTGRANQGCGIAVGASSVSDPTRTTQDILIYNCEVANFGDKMDPGEECGVYPVMLVTRLWVLDSAIHDMAEDGFAGSHGGQRTSSGYYIGRCRIYGNVSNGIDVKQMGQVVISECDIKDAHLSTPNQTGSGEAIVLHYSGDSTPGATATTWKDWPEDVSVLFCTIHDSDFGIVCSDIDRFRAIGNVFYNCKHSTSPWDGSSAYATGTAIHMRGVRMNSYVVNNTIYNCDNGIQMPDTFNAYSATTTYWHGSFVSYSGKIYVCIRDNWPLGVLGVPPTDTGYWQQTKIQMWGNIITSRSEPTGRDIFLSGTWTTNMLDFDRNLTYSPSGEAISYGSSTVRNLAWIRSNTPHQSHGLAVSPLLIAPDAQVFSLQSASPAIGASTEGNGISAYRDFSTLFGIDIKFDRAGNPRPLGQLWDIGAYEFQTDVPDAPTSLRVISR